MKKMMINPLPNDINPKPKREGQYAIVNTLFKRINVEYELCFSFISYYN